MEELDSDLIELILSLLPIPSIIQSSFVCKLWNSITNSDSFKTRISNSRKQPWLFLFTESKDFPTEKQVFGFDPESHDWIKLPPSTSLFSNRWSIGSHGFLSNRRKFSLFSVSGGLQCRTIPVRFYSFSPLIGAYNVNEYYSSENLRFIIVGRATSKRGKFHEYDCLTVEIYNPVQDSWETCPKLPEIFRPGNSPCPSLSSAMLNDKFYVFAIYSGFFISFDLEKRCWSNIRTVRPPGMIISFLVSCQERLFLTGLCFMNDELQFYLWKMDEETLEFSELGIMPRDLLSCFWDNDSSNNNSNSDRLERSLKCVGMGNLVYVLSRIRGEVYYTVCLCEISDSGECCKWRRVPSFYLPEPADEVHTVISLCSNASLQDFPGNGNVTL